MSLSEEGRYYWDGSAWRAASPDRRYFWDGSVWQAASADRADPTDLCVRWGSGWLISRRDGILVQYDPPSQPSFSSGWLRATLSRLRTPPAAHPPALIQGWRILRLDCSWSTPTASQRQDGRFRVITVVLKGGGQNVFYGCTPLDAARFLDDVERRGVAIVEDGVPWPALAPVAVSAAPAATAPNMYKETPCPRCHAPLQAGLARCDYCKTPLLFV